MLVGFFFGSGLGSAFSLLGGVLLGGLCSFSTCAYIKPGLLLPAFNVPARRGQDAAKDSATDKVVEVFCTGSGVVDVQTRLHTLEHLLPCFGQTFNTHRFAGGQQVVRSRFLNTFLGQVPCGFGRQINARTLEHLAEAGDHFQADRIQHRRRDGR